MEVEFGQRVETDRCFSNTFLESQLSELAAVGLLRILYALVLTLASLTCEALKRHISY